MQYMMRKVMLHLISIFLTLGIQWHHWWCFWHHVMQLPIESYNEEVIFTLHFNCLILRNSITLVIIPLSSYDTDPNGITGWKSHVVTHFDHVDLKNAMASFMQLLSSCDAKANSITWWKVMLHLILIVFN